MSGSTGNQRFTDPRARTRQPLGRQLVFAGLVTLAAACAAGDAEEVPSQQEASAGIDSHGPAVPADDLNWGPAPDVFPDGAELAVLSGDPSAAGAEFTVRLRVPAGYIIPPHFHPADEHVTVMEGTFAVGLGNVVDAANPMATLQAGGFITAPERVNHWSIARTAAVLQVHGMGPFQIIYVDENGNSL